VPVVINHTGPYDFLVDTGTQFTVVDPSLAAELHLKTQGTAEAVGIGFKGSTPFARVALLEAGSRSIENHLVLLQDLKLQAGDFHIRGILGGHFLEHFDVLIDYAHSMLCLDDAKIMRASVKGVHVELVAPASAAGEAPLTGLVIIPVHLSNVGPGLLRLALDSGTAVPYLFEHDKYLPLRLLGSATLHVSSGDGVKREYSVLPSQKMQIGPLNFQQVSFVIPAHSDRDVPTTQIDGLLTTALFRSVFINYSDHFVILEPR
jgi:hypothetical protein